jgi:hypothetical protein
VSRPGRTVLAVAVVLGLTAGVPARGDDAASFTGSQVCAGCHAAEAEAWKGSHHAQAMQPATEATVLGDFSGAVFEHHGTTTTFFRSGEKFMVLTDGADGAKHEFPITYTFGVYPLQQYLIGFPGGAVPGARDRLGQPPERAGRWPLVLPLPRPGCSGGRPAALDRARPDLELPVRWLPFDQRGEKFRSECKFLCSDVFRRERWM